VGVSRKSKSYFVLPALLVSIALCALSSWYALRGDNDRFAWWGALAAALPLPLLLARLRLAPRARTAENEPLALLVSAGGALLAAWEWLVEGSAGWGPPATAAAGVALLVVYVFWYSRFARMPSGKLDVGGTLPEFELESLHGNPVSSRELLGKPCVVLFYRGNWCAVCRAQVAELAARRADLDRLGVGVALVSPQPPEASRALAAFHDVPFRFLVDRGARVARHLGIAASSGVPFGVRGGYDPDTVMPTVVVTNAQGRILYSDQTDNYRVRPEPDIYLALLRRTGAMA